MNTATQQKLSFSNDVKRFFNKVLRQRIHLVQSQKSKKPTAQMQSIIDRLTPYRSYAFTDRGAATFLLKKQDDILRMITPQSKTTLQQFDALCSEARYLLKYNCRMSC